MWEGTVVSIYLAPEATEAMMSASEVEAVAGKGLAQDRYFKGSGTFSKPPGPSKEVTLIEIEALDALKRDYKIDLGPEESRRNIVTRGVPLNHLVGVEFNVGEATLRGLRLCEPCEHMARLCQQDIIEGLRHRGGLRAQILSSGKIRVGDRVRASS